MLFSAICTRFVCEFRCILRIWACIHAEMSDFQENSMFLITCAGGSITAGMHNEEKSFRVSSLLRQISSSVFSYLISRWDDAYGPSLPSRSLRLISGWRLRLGQDEDGKADMFVFHIFPLHTCLSAKHVREPLSHLMSIHFVWTNTTGFLV